MRFPKDKLVTAADPRLLVNSLVIHKLPDPVHPGVAASAGNDFSLETRPIPFLPHVIRQTRVFAIFPPKGNS